MSHTILITTDVWYCLHTLFFFRSGMVILSYILYNNLSRPHRWPSGKESAYQYRRCKRCGFDSWVRKIPWNRKWQPTPLYLPGKFQGQRSLAGYSPWGRKELDMTERLYIHTHTHTHTHITTQQTLLTSFCSAPTHLRQRQGRKWGRPRDTFSATRLYVQNSS